MTFEKRPDGRALDELRPIEAKVGVIANAVGSAYFKIGKTFAYAAVYGPRNLYPKFLQDPEKGRLRCHYNMMPFSSGGDRVRPGPSRRSKEIALVTEKALLPVLDLTEFPNAVVDVFIELPQTDAGTRCAGICAASMALADAGLAMKDMVAAVSVGTIGDTIINDLSYEEEAWEGEHVVDLPIAMLSRTKEISLLQMDGIMNRENVAKAIEFVKPAIDKINEVQKAALKDKYKGE